MGWEGWDGGPNFQDFKNMHQPIAYGSKMLKHVKDKMCEPSSGKTGPMPG